MVLNALETRLAGTLHRIFAGSIPKNIALAVSGGLDSMCLAHLMHRVNKENKLGMHMFPIAFDHGLRPESAGEVEFVKAEMAKLGLLDNFQQKALDLKELSPGDSFEELARVKRYDTFHEICSKLKIENVFTGHHMDDNVETFTLRLINNSGVFGLTGIMERSNAPLLSPPYQTLHKLDVIRPLLDTTKEELYHYAEENNIKWVEDPSNAEMVAKRNIIRQYLKENPQKKEDLINLQKRTNEMNAQLEKTVDKIYKELSDQGAFIFEKSEVKIMIPVSTLSYHSDLVLARLFFKLLYPYSPLLKYHYKFQRLLGNMQNLRKYETFTLLGLKWEITLVDEQRSNHAFIRIKRQSIRNEVPMEIQVAPKSESEWVLYDNIYWFKVYNRKSTPQTFAIRYTTTDDIFLKKFLGKKKKLKSVIGLPIVFTRDANDNSKDDSNRGFYLPTYSDKNHDQNPKKYEWKLKRNMFSFDPNA